MSTYEPSLFDLEDHGYSRGMGHMVLPSGQLIAVHQEDDEMAAALVYAGWTEWQEEIEVRSALLNDNEGVT